MNSDTYSMTQAFGRLRIVELGRIERSIRVRQAGKAKMLLRVSICAIVYLSFGIASEEPRDVNICDLTRLADQLDSKLVRVRGILRNSETAAEPFFDELVPENCSDAEGRGMVIRIVSPDVHFLANLPHGYKPDMSSISCE